MEHTGFMREALALADEAAAHGEVPIGAVVVVGSQVVGRGWNRPVSTNDPTAHAEVEALRDAGRTLGNYRLIDSTLYVTVEPCLMCVGAVVLARIRTVVFGAPDPRAGALESSQRAHEHPALNHRIRVVAGVLAPECGVRMQRFFRDRRRR